MCLSTQECLGYEEHGVRNPMAQTALKSELRASNCVLLKVAKLQKAEADLKLQNFEADLKADLKLQNSEADLSPRPTQ